MSGGKKPAEYWAYFESQLIFYTSVSRFSALLLPTAAAVVQQTLTLEYESTLMDSSSSSSRVENLAKNAGVFNGCRPFGSATLAPSSRCFPPLRGEIKR